MSVLAFLLATPEDILPYEILHTDTYLHDYYFIDCDYYVYYEYCDYYAYNVIMIL